MSWASSLKSMPPPDHRASVSFAMAKSSSALSWRQSPELERINNAVSRGASETLERPWIGVFLQYDQGGLRSGGRSEGIGPPRSE